jgi:predicted DNA-binding protein
MENKNNEKKTTSIRISQDVWQKYRILCLRKQRDASEWIEELINKEVEKDEKAK